MYQTQNAASEHCRSDMLPKVSRRPAAFSEFALSGGMLDSDMNQDLEEKSSDMDLNTLDILRIIPRVSLLAITLDHEPKVRGQEPVIAEKEWLSFHLWCIRST